MATSKAFINTRLQLYPKQHCCAFTCRGSAQNGELGYGPAGKKSSANPDKCLALEGLKVRQVAAGIAFTLFLVEGIPEDKLEDFEVWENEEVEQEVVPLNATKGAACAISRLHALTVWTCTQEWRSC